MTFSVKKEKKKWTCDLVHLRKEKIIIMRITIIIKNYSIEYVSKERCVCE